MGIANITNNILVDSGLIAGSANGIATLDSGGKIPATQLPNSVMEFKGVWSAATNTPTLANGTGNAGDVYEVAAAGSVDFGAGPISFSVGDYVVYDGSQWQFSSGQKGTITSLAFSAPLTGGTITTSGTVGITQASGSTDGYLSSTDWTTFNNKQNALTNPITGTGTTGQVAYFNGTTSITSESNLFWDATNDRLGIGTTNPAYNLHLVTSSTSVAAFRNSAAAIGQILVGNTVSDLAIRILASGDSLIFSDTGKYLAFGTNGATERMRLDATGNLGIGTTSPAYRLQVDGASTAGFVTPLLIKNPSTNAASAVKMAFDGGGTIWGEIGSSYNTNNPYMAFFVRANSEKMRITDGGNVAIGTLLPTSYGSYTTLCINNAGNGAVIDLLQNDIRTGSIYTSVSGAGLNINTVTSNPLIFLTANTERARFTSGGNLLVGTTTDGGQRLQVNGSGYFNGSISTSGGSANDVLTQYLTIKDITSTNDYVIRFRNSANTQIGYIGAISSNGQFYYNNSNGHNFTGGAATFSSSVQGLFFKSTNGTVETVLSYSSTPAGVVGTLTNHPLEFYTNSSPKMTLSATGNLGIGVSPSAWGIIFKVIEGIGATSLGFRSNAIELINNAFYDGTNWIYKNNGLVNRYNITNGQYIWYTAPSGTAGNAITFTPAMTLDASGNLGLGTASPSYKLHIENGTSDVNAYVGQTPTRGLFWQWRYNATAASAYGEISTYGGTNDLRIQAQGGAGKTIINATSGNLLIGTTTDGGQKLQVNGTAAIDGVLSAKFAGGQISIENGGTRAAIVMSSANSILKISDWATVSKGLSIDMSTGASTFSSGLTAASLLLTTASFVLKSVAGNTYGFTIFNDSATDIVSLTNYYSSSLTFGTTNTERMRITSGGNLLVGTTTDVGSKVSIQANTSGNAIWMINDATLNYSQTYYGGTASSGFQFIRADGRSGGYIAFGTQDTERMRIANNGNLLIGTTTDSGQKLQVSGDTTSQSIFIEGASGTGGALRIKQFAGSAANMDGYSTISTLTSGVFYFTSATTAPNFKNFQLDPSGLTNNILRTYTLPDTSGTIALTSDIPVLTLTTTGTSGAATLVGNTLNIPQYSGGGGSSSIGGTVTGGTTGSILFIDPTATLAQDNANLFWDNTNNRLGIGTATPSFTFHVSGANAGIFLTRTAPDEAFLLLSNPAITVGGQIRGLSSTLGLRFTNASSLTEWARFTANGRFLIGTATEATYLLDVNGTGRYQDNLLVSKNQNASTVLTVSNTTSGTGSGVATIFTSDASSGNFTIGKYSTATTAYKTIAAKDGYLFNAATGGNISILNDFATGTIRFAAGGSSTAQLTIAANGNITQSVNQNAQTLFTISNTTSGTASLSGIVITSDSSSSSGTIAKRSTTLATYKMLNVKDFYIYNDTLGGGDIAILNDFATGTIKFAAGGSSTSQAVIKTTGQLQLNNYTSASSFTGTAVAGLGVDASGNVITTSSSSLTTLDVYLIKETYK